MAGLMALIGDSVKGRLAAAKLNLVEDEIRKFILRNFADTGRAPSLRKIREELELVSMEFADFTVEKLARADILTRKGGKIISAYPFSAEETRHHVIFTDGRRVYALCATDAFGIHFMLHEDITILSRCPWCEGVAEVVVVNGLITSHNPVGILEFVGDRERCGCTAETCCPHINFYCSGDHLTRWKDKNPELANGETLTLDEALRYGKMIFEDFLR